MKRTLRFEAFYPHPVNSVWEALTDPRAIEEWHEGMKTDFEPRVGRAFTFRSKPQPGWDGVTYCEVTEVVAHRRLSYTWKGGLNDPPTTVTWTLSPEGNGTRVTLEHDGFNGLRGWFESLLLGFGWRGLVKNALRAVVARRASAQKAA